MPPMAAILMSYIGSSDSSRSAWTSSRSVTTTPACWPSIWASATSCYDDVEALDDPRLHPEVELLGGPVADDPAAPLRVRLTERDGGLGRVLVLVNGTLARESRPDELARRGRHDGDAVVLEVPVAGDPRIMPGRENLVEVFAYNREGYLRSRGTGFPFLAPAPGARGADPPLGPGRRRP